MNGLIHTASAFATFYCELLTLEKCLVGQDKSKMFIFSATLHHSLKICLFELCV